MEKDLMAKMKEEFELYRNCPTIAEKLDSEGNLGQLVQSIDTVLTNEIRFTLSGRLTRGIQNEAKYEEFSYEEARRGEYVHFQTEH